MAVPQGGTGANGGGASMLSRITSRVSEVSKDDLHRSFHEIKTPRRSKNTRKQEQQDDHEQRNPNPLDSVSWLSAVTIWWLGPLLSRGAVAPLQESDVWDLPMTDQALAAQGRFDVHWKAHSDKTTYRFLFALWQTTWPTMRYAIVLQLLSAVCSIVQPLLIKSLVQFLENEDNMFGIQSGYTLAIILGVITFVNATLLNGGLFISSRSGCTGRIILINSVYKKLLTLSAMARRTMNTGEAVTLVGVDSERLLEAYNAGVWTVISPLMLAAVAILIGTQTDAIVGLVSAIAMVCIIVLAGTTSRRVGKYRYQIAIISGERVKVMNETLQGIRVIKLYGWEHASSEKIREIRQKEIALMHKYNFLRLYNSILMYLGPTLLNVVCFVTYILRGYTLDVATAFVILALTNACKSGLTIFGNATVYVSEAIASTKRVSAFLLAEDVIDQQHLLHDPNAQSLLKLENAEFKWTHDTPTPTLININLTLVPQSLTIIVGTVGSGKSSLMNAILGEMLQTRGTRTINGAIAYASQQPWIQNQTLRENILFGEPYERDHYQRVITACQLLPDFAMLEDGDSTEIGERGINLSGGQKARVSVARAMYRVRHCDFLLFDDPLSALDVHVANSVFADGLNGLGKTKTRLLVLNSHYHFLQYADRILVMDSGKIIGDGNLDALKGEFPFLVSSHDPTSEDTEYADNSTQCSLVDEDVDTESCRSSSVAATAKMLVTTEDRLVGSVAWKTYIRYLGSCGWNGHLVVSVVGLLFAIAQVSFFFNDWFISQWSKGAFNFSQDTSMGVYVGLVALSSALMFVRCIVYMATCMQCSEKLHLTYLRKVLAAPVTTFFDVTPVGRILNRFSRDMDQVDSPLPYYSIWMLLYIFQTLSSFIVCAVVAPYVLIAYIPLGAIFMMVVRVYQSSARELKRIDSISRTPFLNLVSETISGIDTIRSYRMSDRFAFKCEVLLNHSSKFFFTFQASQRWFTMRADWMVSFIIGVVSLLLVAMRSHLGAAAAGLALTYASQLSSTFQRTMTFITQTETIMTCFERIAHYGSLDEEGHTREPTNELTLSPEWPRSGQVVFDNISMRYRDDLELVLKNVSFTITSGEKVGVCGRTGSGKSSLMSLLFRVVECTSGRVLIDGVDISTITVHQLRAKLTIIPQDPVLFSGPLRRNLDPFDEKTDADLWAVLKKVHLLDTVSAWGEGLEYDVAENGDNLSVGQRQLICIARALIRESKVIVMDEATANVDQESDKLIQETVRESFGGGDKTVLSIAHRLETIMDSDKILVLDAGEVKEFDSPQVLMQQEGGIFQSLVEASKAVGKHLE